MVRDPITVAADLSLGRFMDEVVWPHRYTAYPVVDDGRAVGLLPFRSVAEVPRGEWDGRSVRDAMLPLDDVPALAEDDDLVDALAKLGSSDVRRGLVLDDGRLAGLLSITDLSRALEVGGPRRRLRRAG
jgi:CBS domain-containing protein